MIALWIAGGVALFLAALLVLPVHLIILYKDQVTVRLRILFVTVTLFPARPKSEKALKKAACKKEKKAKKAAKRAKKKPARPPKAATASAPPRKRTMQENLRLIRSIVSVLFRKANAHLRLKAAKIHLRVATGDAATTALAYGAVSASLAFLLEALDRVTKLKAKPGDVMVVADYLSEHASADVKLIFTLRIWGALSTLLGTVWTFLKHKNAPNQASKQANSKH